MIKKKPAGGVNQPTSNKMERVAKVMVNFLTWLINLTKIHSCAYNTSATLLNSTMRRATLQSVTNKCGDTMYIRFIRCVITHISVT